MRMELVMLEIARFVVVAAWSEVRPETVRFELSAVAPVTVRVDATVDEAFEMKPPWRRERPVVVDQAVVSPPLNERAVEVAALGNGYANVWKPASLVNQERLIEEEAIG